MAWGKVVAQVDLRVHSILLSNTQFYTLVGSYLGSSIPIGKSVNQSPLDIVMTQDALRTCVVVTLESLPKSKEVLYEMWVMGGLRLILVAHGRLIPPPSGWSLS